MPCKYWLKKKMEVCASIIIDLTYMIEEASTMRGLSVWKEGNDLHLCCSSAMECTPLRVLFDPHLLLRRSVKLHLFQQTLGLNNFSTCITVILYLFINSYIKLNIVRHLSVYQNKNAYRLLSARSIKIESICMPTADLSCRKYSSFLVFHFPSLCSTDMLIEVPYYCWITKCKLVPVSDDHILTELWK